MWRSDEVRFLATMPLASLVELNPSSIHIPPHTDADTEIQNSALSYCRLGVGQISQNIQPCSTGTFCSVALHLPGAGSASMPASAVNAVFLRVTGGPRRPPGQRGAPGPQTGGGCVCLSLSGRRRRMEDRRPARSFVSLDAVRLCAAYAV